MEAGSGAQVEGGQVMASTITEKKAKNKGKGKDTVRVIDFVVRRQSSSYWGKEEGICM